jgi:hypothetical protein
MDVPKVPKVWLHLAKVIWNIKWWWCYFTRPRSQPIQFPEMNQIANIPQRKAVRLNEVGFSYNEYLDAKGCRPLQVKLRRGEEAEEDGLSG